MASDSFPDFSSRAAREVRAAGEGGFLGRCRALGIGCGAGCVPPAAPGAPTVRL